MTFGASHLNHQVDVNTAHSFRGLFDKLLLVYIHTLQWIMGYRLDNKENGKLSFHHQEQMVGPGFAGVLVVCVGEGVGVEE